MEFTKKREDIFRPRILLEGNFFNIRVWFQCIVYWIPRIYILSHIKSNTSDTFLVDFKLAEGLQCILKVTLRYMFLLLVTTMEKLQKQPPTLFCKKGALNRFFSIYGKYLCWSIFLIKLEAVSPANLLKRDSNTSVFLWTLQDLYERLFWRASSNDCF